MKFYKSDNSIFDQEYDYMVSLGHRCCVGQGLNYMRKSSFPFDWQITQINGLPNLFRNNLQNFYGNPFVEFVHEINFPDGTVDTKTTFETYQRRSDRLVKLLQDNNRKLLFIRSKYTWYWYKNNNLLQKDMYPVNYDLQCLMELSDVLTNQYKNTNFEILYVYQDTRNWTDWEFNQDGVCSGKEFVLPSNEDSVEIAKSLTYIEQDGFKDKHITPFIVYPGKHRLEGNRYLTEIFKHVRLTNIQDFKLPYGFE